MSAPKIVFPHVMKTAGTSLIEALQRNYSTKEILSRASTWSQLRTQTPDMLSPVRFVRGHFGSGILRVFGEHNGFTPICLLRDPVERVISHFWHYRSASDDQRFPFMRNEAFTLEEFLDYPEVQYLVCNYHTANYSANLVNSMDLPDGPAPEISELNFSVAREFLNQCACVGISEQLERFAVQLEDVLGLHVAIGATRHRSYARGGQVAPETLAKIRRLNEIDYELYEQAKTLSQRQRLKRSRQNPNVPDPTGVILWRAGYPFWGAGWSNVMGTGSDSHIWSCQTRADLHFDVASGVQYTVLIGVLRFVAPVQASGFIVYVNGSQVSYVTVPLQVAKGMGHVYAVPLKQLDSTHLSLALRVDDLMSFKDVANDTDDTKRGLALAMVMLIPNDMPVPTQALKIDTLV